MPKRARRPGRVSPLAPEGYKRYFAALEVSKKSKRPAWVALSKHSEPEADDRSIPATSLPSANIGTVQVLEESLHPAVLSSIIAGAKKGAMIAVKNLDATLRRIELPEDIVVLPSADALLSLEAAEKFLRKDGLKIKNRTTQKYSRIQYYTIYKK